MSYRDKLQSLIDEAQAMLNEIDILTISNDDGTKKYADCQQSYLHGKTMGLKIALKYLEGEDELQK